MSSLDFRLDEVLELAEEIERNGAAYYRRAAAVVHDGSVRALLESLATKEDEHEKCFHTLRSLLSGSSSFDVKNDEENISYLRAFASRSIFHPTSGIEQSDYDLDATTVLKTALGLEKDSIAFYLGIRQSTEGKEALEIVDRIIREEMGHVTELAMTLKNLEEA